MPELSIVMPCLNEAETVALCVDKARRYLEQAGIDGEVVVADNGSTDGSPAIALAHGARVVEVAEKGYGNALMGGIRAARGRFVIMGDADDSYDFTDLDPFVDKLREGYDLVMGNRFLGGIEKGAMPVLHRYVGNPVLSGIGRLFFRAPVGDFHCGLRGFRRDSLLALNLRTTGMEFASEVVVRASLAGQRICEVPTTLRPDGRSRSPHLRSFRDGWRHLRFLLIYSPRWLFLYPGLLMLLIGLVASTLLVAGPASIGDVTFDIGTLLLASALAIMGYQSVMFAVLTDAYATNVGFLPPGGQLPRIAEKLTFERGILVGLGVFAFGLLAALAAFWRWRGTGFGDLDASQTVRTLTPAVLGLVLGFQTVLSGLFLSILAVGRAEHPTEPAETPVVA